MFEVYITKAAKYLPNEAVSNDEMEAYLGLINDTASKARRIILRNNKITSRYYAVDKTGKSTHSNAQLTRNAILPLFDENFTPQDLEVLSCGTSTPDIFLPSHAAMVHGLLKNVLPRASKIWPPARKKKLEENTGSDPLTLSPYRFF